MVVGDNEGSQVNPKHPFDELFVGATIVRDLRTTLLVTVKRTVCKYKMEFTVKLAEYSLPKWEFCFLIFMVDFLATLHMGFH